ncbi:UTRA domain-containing protein, partial [Salmonella enterica subsp. enterica serovar Kentucky]|nr:UTRA domain-containing protein [Salmonella enterica subsp. enterica serovar Kentucky]
SDVFLLKRIRYVDEDAVSIEESWVPAHLIHDVDAIGISLYDYYMEFIFHLWEGDQKTVKKFRHLDVFSMKMKFIFHVLLKAIT